MADWITCIECKNRFGAFMRTCPICGTTNKTYYYTISEYESKKSVNSRVRRKRIIILSSVIAVIVLSVVLAITVSWSSVTKSHLTTIAELKQYALKKINQDRSKYGLGAVELSDNNAAQAHAEELLKTETLSHWTTDGMKPYMRYSLYNGHDYVAQNVAESKYGIVSITISGQSSDIFDNARLSACKRGIAICTDTVDPYKSIDDLQYAMMYNDDKCCQNGHRDNILDMHHTHVSLGIAYNKFYFAIVENFENKYTVWSTPISYNNVSNTVSMNGFVKKNATFKALTVSYDPLPSEKTYEQNLDKHSYQEGLPIAQIVKSAFSHGNNYDWNSKLDLIDADRWKVNDNDYNNSLKNNNNSNFDISFSMNRLTERYGRGVYTINTWYVDENNETFIATSVSLFVNK